MKHFATFSLIVLLVGCKPDKTSDFSIEELSEQEADAVALRVDSISKARLASATTPDTALIRATAARGGASARQWKQLLKNVFSNDAFRKATYFGPSNRKGVGTLFDKNLELEGQLTQAIDEPIYNSLLAEANKGSLEAKTSKGFEFDVAFDVNTLPVDGSIKNQISRLDSSRCIAGSWKEINLDWDKMRQLAESSNNDKLNRFIKTFKDKKTFIISKAILVDGFKSEIFTKNSINAELAAKIDKTIIKIGDSNASIKFKTMGEKTILVETSGYFYPFGILSKKKVD